MQNQASSQCTVTSSDGYTVTITTELNNVVVNNNQCPGPGFNYDVNLTYDAVFSGSNIPAGGLYTLQGYVQCNGGVSLYYNMNNKGGTATVTTGGNAWNSNCNNTTLGDLGCSSTNIQINGPGISNQTINCSSTVLPIELLSFSAEEKEGAVYVQWATASEINNDYFIVERLIGNGEWQVIKEVPGGGMSNTTLSYEYLDEDVNLYEDIYYRLTQVDFDGKEETFDLVKVSKSKKQELDHELLMSNSKIEVILNNDHNDYIEITLLNSVGEHIKTVSSRGVLKGQSLSIDIHDLNSGYYIVGISTKSTVQYQKIMRVK